MERSTQARARLRHPAGNGAKLAAARQQAAYYERPATVFGSCARNCRSRCHAKDEVDPNPLSCREHSVIVGARERCAPVREARSPCGD